jgi:hypothetical protein
MSYGLGDLTFGFPLKFINRSISNSSFYSLDEGSTSLFSSRSIPTEQNLHEKNEIPNISSAVNSNPITTNPEIQSWPDESTLSLITDEDFILADILERSANEEQHTSIYFSVFK